MTKYWIAGSRSASKEDMQLMSETIEKYVLVTDVVRTGGAKGVDRFAEKIAESLNIGVASPLIPDWKRFGRGAGMIRNKEGVDWADKVLVFWDGGSRGTKNVIDHAKKQNKLVEVILI